MISFSLFIWNDDGGNRGKHRASIIWILETILERKKNGGVKCTSAVNHPLTIDTKYIAVYKIGLILVHVIELVICGMLVLFFFRYQSTRMRQWNRGQRRCVLTRRHYIFAAVAPVLMNQSRTPLIPNMIWYDMWYFHSRVVIRYHSHSVFVNKRMWILFWILLLDNFLRHPFDVCNYYAVIGWETCFHGSAGCGWLRDFQVILCIMEGKMTWNYRTWEEVIILLCTCIQWKRLLTVL